MALSSSDGVAMPGANGSPQPCAAFTTAGLSPGATPKFAPASLAFLACSGVNIVPTPKRMPGTSAAILRTASRPASVRSVSSIALLRNDFFLESKGAVSMLQCSLEEGERSHPAVQESPGYGDSIGRIID